MGDAVLLRRGSRSPAYTSQLFSSALPNGKKAWRASPIGNQRRARHSGLSPSPPLSAHQSSGSGLPVTILRSTFRTGISRIFTAPKALDLQCTHMLRCGVRIGWVSRLNPPRSLQLRSVSAHRRVSHRVLSLSNLGLASTIRRIRGKEIEWVP